MPILPPEAMVFPEGLFSDAQKSENGRRWCVLHTRPRQEKCVARELRELELPFFLPVVSHRSLVRGRPLVSYLPLFTSYLFLLIHEDKDRVRALATHRVAHCLPVHDQPKLWFDLRQIHQLIESGVAITPEQKLGPGMAVQIQSGPLAGLRGIILRTASGRRFVVQVNFIQQGASVVLDDYTVVRADRLQWRRRGQRWRADRQKRRAFGSSWAISPLALPLLPARDDPRRPEVGR